MADTPEKSSARPVSESKPRLIGPPAAIAPAANDTCEANTILLFPLPLEFLCVQVTFHRAPMVGLKVRFVTLDGVLVEDNLQTDTRGTVCVARRVVLGAYVCEIERQDTVRVYTVVSPERTFPVTLPIGRLYTDLREREELPKRLRNRAATRS